MPICLIRLSRSQLRAQMGAQGFWGSSHPPMLPGLNTILILPRIHKQSQASVLPSIFPPPMVQTGHTKTFNASLPLNSYYEAVAVIISASQAKEEGTGSLNSLDKVIQQGPRDIRLRIQYYNNAGIALFHPGLFRASSRGHLSVTIFRILRQSTNGPGWNALVYRGCAISLWSIQTQCHPLPQQAVTSHFPLFSFSILHG